MRTSKFGLRALGLAVVAALGLMAFSAVGAQAAEFKVLGSGALAVGETVSGRQIKPGEMGTEGPGKLLVPGRSLTIECKKADVIEGIINSATDALAQLLFLECVALNSKKESEELSGCFIPEKMITAYALILPVAANKVLAEADEKSPNGSNFAIIKFEKEKGCALPLENKVTGGIVAEVSPAGESVKPLLKFSEAIQKASGDKLLFGTFESFIDGEAEVELTGTAHKGCSFGVL